MIDKVFSLVITFVVVLVLGIFLFTSVFSHQAATQQAARLSYEQEYSELFVNSLFLTHDNETQLTYDSLLALSLKQINTIVYFNGHVINITERFSVPLDEVLGKDNYYFTVSPLRKGVAVSYILDGSASMAEKRMAVKQGLPLLVSNLQALFGNEAVIYTDIYILSKDQTMCAQFPDVTTENIIQHCTVLTPEKLYAKLEAHGLLGPYVKPYGSFAEWAQASHSAGASDFGDSDWASASAYASFAYQDDAQRKSLTNKHVIVAVADEMASGSKADECFIKEDKNDKYFCFLCNATCPIIRGERIVNETLKVLQQNGDLFIGFHSVVCDYQYDTAANDYYLTPYTCKFQDTPSKCSGLADGTTAPLSSNPAADVNWCTQQACGGCKKQGTTYCYHTNCEQYVIAGLQNLSEVTGGKTQPLTNLDDLTTVVHQYFSRQLQDYNLTLGVYNETRDRYVVNKPFTLADGTKLELLFWVYD
jgi:hypothetical protein